MPKFTIAREAKAWEETTIEADSFEHALELIENEDYHNLDLSWALDHDTWETTGSYWGRNEDTEEDFTKNA